MTLEANIAVWATRACAWEATAPKPGNVHRGADFEDLTFADMLGSAAALGPALAGAAASGSVGLCVERGVGAMLGAVGVNAHLGTVLLLAPLAVAAHTGGPLVQGAAGAARSAGVDDAARAYGAIRAAKPGGLGRVATHDVSAPPRVSLYEAMCAAAGHDLVAAQYANGFEDVARAADWVAGWLEMVPLVDALVATHVAMMSHRPDTLIQRKCGPAVARESADRAAHVVASGPPASDAFRSACQDLDFWLRADGNRRNPGATADVLAAALFVLQGDGRLPDPVRFY